MPAYDFSILYDRSYPYLYQLVASFSCNTQFIEDVLQEIYLAAWVHFRSDPHPNPFGWLIVTARHKAHDMVRRQMRETQRLIPWEDEDTLCFSEIPASLPGEQFEQLLELDMPYQHLQLLLSEDELALLVAHYEEGFSVAELSARLNISARACYMRLHRARKKLEPLVRAS